MRLIALVGKSGTGKSFKAIDVCKDKDIDGIIDDGLFIFRGQIASGHSAKKDKTKIGKNAFIGSNSIIVAPVEIGNDVLTAAGSVITKNIPDEALAFGRAKQVNKEKK